MAAAASTSVRKMVMMVADSNVKPLTLEDKQVLGLVYDCYVVNKPGENFDPEALFTLLSHIFIRSFRISDPSIKYDPLEKVDNTYLTNLDPPTDLLKHFACQMRGTQRHEHHTNAHETTMSILKALDSYSWCAKAVTALAAFALEYGVFWHLYDQKLQRQADSLGNSLAVLCSVRAVNQSDISDYNVVVKHVFMAVEHVVRLERLMKTYDGKNIPTLEKAMHEFPAFVYWIVLTIVILATHMDILMGHPMSQYKLSDIGSKISTIDIKLKDYLTQIDSQRAYIDEYRYRDRIAFQTPTEIVQVLKCLLFRRDLNDDPHLYCASTGQMVSIEVFRMKHVLLFISGLYSIDDETFLLRKIHEGLLQSDPRTVKGFKKEDFKILWAPIVDEEEEEEEERGIRETKRKQFEEMKRKMKWFVVDYAVIPPICKRLIRERLKYQNNPVVPVFNHQGRLTNDDALHMLFTWELQAFPWRKGDDLALNQRGNWIWNDIKKYNPHINNWINDDAYIIIYGRTETDWYDEKWLGKMPEALERIKKDVDIIRRFDIRINYSHHGRGDKERQTVAKFWSYVESTFDSMRRMKADDVDDDTFRQVKSFLGLRQEHSGWVILSKGPNVKLLGRGDIFYDTLHDFDSWKHNIERDFGGFDVSLRNYYESLLSKLPLHAACRNMVLKNYLGNVYDPVHCPDCGLKMNLNSAEYICCHGHKDEVNYNNADASGGDVEIMR